MVRRNLFGIFISIFVIFFVFTGMEVPVFADTNSVWHHASDIRGGVLGSDEGFPNFILNSTLSLGDSGKITDVPTPINGSDAVNKDYVDAQVGRVCDEGVCTWTRSIFCPSNWTKIGSGEYDIYGFRLDLNFNSSNNDKMGSFCCRNFASFPPNVQFGGSICSNEFCTWARGRVCPSNWMKLDSGELLSDGFRLDPNFNSSDDNKMGSFCCRISSSFPDDSEVCGSGKDICIVGNVYNSSSNSTHHIWYCSGVNGGNDTMCSKLKPPSPVNGVCNNAIRNGCTSGTSNDGAYNDTPTHYRWRCEGLNGGNNSGMCSKAKSCGACQGTCAYSSSVSCGTSIPAVSGTCSNTGVSCTKSCSGTGTYCSYSSYTCDGSSCVPILCGTCVGTCASTSSEACGTSLPYVSGTCSISGASCTKTCGTGTYCSSGTCVGGSCRNTRTCECTSSLCDSSTAGEWSDGSGACTTSGCSTSSNSCNAPSCPSRSSVACGSPIPDQSGTYSCTGNSCTRTCSGIGTYCSSGTCDGGTCKTNACVGTCASSSSISCGSSIPDVQGTYSVTGNSCTKPCSGTGTYCSSGTCDGGTCKTNACVGTCASSSSISCGSSIPGVQGTYSVTGNSCTKPCSGTGTYCSSGTCDGGTCKTNACVGTCASSSSISCGSSIPGVQGTYSVTGNSCTKPCSGTGTKCSSGKICDGGTCKTNACVGTCASSSSISCGSSIPGVQGTYSVTGNSCTKPCSGTGTKCSSGKICDGGTCKTNACVGTCASSSSISCGSSIPGVQGTYSVTGNSCTKPCSGTGTKCSSGKICDGGTCKTNACVGTCASSSSISCGSSIPGVQGTYSVTGNSCTKPCSGTGTKCSSGKICDGGTCKTNACVGTCASSSSISCGSSIPGVQGTYSVTGNSCTKPCSGTGTKCSSGKICDGGTCKTNACVGTCASSSSISCGSSIPGVQGTYSVTGNSCTKPCSGTGTKCSTGTCISGSCSCTSESAYITCSGSKCGYQTNNCYYSVWCGGPACGSWGTCDEGESAGGSSNWVCSCNGGSPIDCPP